MAAKSNAEEKKSDSSSSNKPGQLLIALGSSSAIKQKVVKETFASKNVEVVGLSFASGVPEQPVGKAETQKGAQFRAEKAKELKPDASVWIGIENGMYRQTPDDHQANNQDNEEVFKYWFDVGCIFIIYKDDKNDQLQTDVCWSDSLPIPIENTKDCLEKDGKSAKNNGNHTWSPLKDPHSELTNGKRPRKMWLLDAMKKWKESSIFKQL
eukprot:CAMPEP_0202733030 /NCGR_PEP_ID=MMETSP1385-20130828/187963_1 /ASSEMBLY_ACC=CAM_ASM_000861 /TAXON_ID=933848 /ORGANISM="Elphidium margaritaceum" /LENGTH=209 /DNA_ID=CAMNT_0049399357 /DNA_START=27 /DNA_END=656 /DNA_ORIENTATION=-